MPSVVSSGATGTPRLSSAMIAASTVTAMRTIPRETPSAGLMEGWRAAYSVRATTAMRERPSAHTSTNRRSNVPESQRPRRPGRASSGRISINPPIRTAQPIGTPSDGGGVLSGRSPPGPLNQRAAASRTRRATPGPPAASANRKTGMPTSGGAAMSFPASLVIGRGISFFAPMSSKPTKALETFPNPKPERDYVIRFDCPEFTCLCPKTGQPDFATIRIEYVPDKLCVELKSWKVYLWSYRDEGAFHEAVTNRILDDLVAAVSPRRLRVEGEFNIRGGITTTIIATHEGPVRTHEVTQLDP